jgi:parvulin-like peptidyl-prolyl isomerase
MLKNLRNVVLIKAMMWIVAISFVALMVFDWGAGGMTCAGPGDTVGVINGRKISHQQFVEALRDASRQAKGSNNAEPEESQLISQIWDQMVAQILYAQQIEAHEIAVSDAEVNFINRNQPVEWVRNQEVFQTDGRFDPEKYGRFLDDPGTYSSPERNQFVLSAEYAVRQAVLISKLQEMVAGGVRVTSAEAREAFVRQKEKVRVAYAAIEAYSIADSLVSVSDEQIQAYYSGHPGEFHREAAVNASFVAFEKKPSAADEADAEAEIRDLLTEIRAGGEFAALARSHSDDPGSAQRGGDLGFFGRGRMVKPFEEAAFALEPGTISEPVRSRFGWHILKVEERKGEGEGLEVRARHILLKIRPGRDTLDSLRLESERFQERADEADFLTAVAEQGLQAKETGFITAGGYFPLLGNRTSGLVNSFLSASPGRVSPPYETEQGIYVFVLLARREAGPQPLDEVYNRIATRLKTTEKVNIASTRMAPLLEDVRSGVSLENAAHNRDIRFAESKPFSRDDFVQGVGRRNAFTGAAFRLESGSTSGVVATDRGAYVLQLLEKEPIDEVEFKVEVPKLIERLRAEKQNEVLAAWFSDLKEQAEIIDNRHLFYSNF